MRILFIGDIVGRPGRRILAARLAGIVSSQSIDLVVANCENVAAGFGVTPDLAEQLLEAGVHVLTSGNHVWDKKAILDYLPAQKRLLRPANYPDAPGSGIYTGATSSGVRYAVMNLQGRTYLPAIHCPFRTADHFLATLASDIKVRFVDFHAEVTSEKIAFGWYLDGRVSAVVGTHTHVPTADERVLPGGTAYITDAGMTGPHDSVIGMDKEGSLHRFLTGIPARFEPASDDVRLNGVIVDVDEISGRALSIERYCCREE
jgi:metallophosphoesterase (TIGR00282 family)